MPGHFTHIYTARRVADYLASGQVEDWPARTDTHTTAAAHHEPKWCGEKMILWEKFTAIGAIGPDLFYFSQDYNNRFIGPHSDRLMLDLATYYYFDAAKEKNWEPLLIILAETNGEMANILRILIKLQKMWQDFVDAWNATIGPMVDLAGEILDDLTGGLLSQFKVTIEELKQALLQIGKEELLTFGDIFSLFDTCVQKGWQEQSFLWSDMSHYRQTSGMCEALVAEAEALRLSHGEKHFEQFMAFALGYMTHVGTDVIGHAWVNQQVGGPFRNHPGRHHLIENHVDAWNYKNAGFARDERVNPELTPDDPWGSTEDYPDLSMSALWFAVQIDPKDPDHPYDKQRPSPLPEDPKAREKALDVDGEMPTWMAEAIVRAMKRTFADRPHPKIFGGDNFQATIDEEFLGGIFKKVTGHEFDRPFDEILAGIAPAPSFAVPPGFPLPWQIQTMYRIMITYYKFSYNGTWELQKPRHPDSIITPPASDFNNLFQAPDFSGVDGSDPASDACGIFIALFEWAVKELEAAAKLAGDLIKMALSPLTYGLRLGLYELAMKMWDIAMKTHDVLAHTGLAIPHGEQRYENGELRLANEIDIPLITLGGSVDSAFRQALADAIDPLGHLDTAPNTIGPDHSVFDSPYPYYPVFNYHLKNGKTDRPTEADPLDDTPFAPAPLEGWEYKRPWAYPTQSLYTDGDPKHPLPFPTPTEDYDPSQSDPNAPSEGPGHVRPGPYPAGTRPDHVFFRLDAPVNPQVRADYENAQTPFQTDRLNAAHLQDSDQILTHRRLSFSPLGDPVPFSAYLITRLVNPTGYSTQFNLDGDRGYGYLTWDWLRADNREAEDGGLHTFTPPRARPAGDDQWVPDQGSLSDVGKEPMQLAYVDVPPIIG